VSVFVTGPGISVGYNPTLWLSAGTAGATLALPGLIPSNGPSTSFPATSTGDSFWFRGFAPASGVEPWRINFLTGSIGIAADLAPGPGSSSPFTFIPLDHNKGVALTASPFGISSGVWIMDGAGGMPRLIPGTPSYTYLLFSAGSRIFFVSWVPGGTYPLYSIELCPADYDNSGTSDVADLFAFLKDWFAGDMNADFDNSGGAPALSDLFQFIQAWMVGCDE
jgi:hypothetical protein